MAAGPPADGSGVRNVQLCSQSYPCLAATSESHSKLALVKVVVLHSVVLRRQNGGRDSFIRESNNQWEGLSVCGAARANRRRGVALALVFPLQLTEMRWEPAAGETCTFDK